MSMFRNASQSFANHACSNFLYVCKPSVAKASHPRAISHLLGQPGHPRVHTFSITSIRRLHKHQRSSNDPNTDSSGNSTASATDSINEQIATSAHANAFNSFPFPEHETPAPSDSLPWYLKQQTPTIPQAQESIEIPDLPLHPPPLLKVLLEYISVTAGLDHLQLLDLRKIDPPAALGANLIMIFATARSEKHLHVSADRLCRYLRKEHGLKANAAGLLGRNELKIKLRRKLKRMKMFANMGGAALEGSIDDGIRTGWICCTIGKVAAHPLDTGVSDDGGDGFVGFIDHQPGVNLVVQMFTEEKRAETDLETLWNGVLKTHQRNNERADETLEELKEELQSLESDSESVK